jgi:hypothetical protein
MARRRMVKKEKIMEITLNLNKHWLEIFIWPAVLPLYGIQKLLSTLTQTTCETRTQAWNLYDIWETISIIVPVLSVIGWAVLIAINWSVPIFILATYFLGILIWFPIKVMRKYHKIYEDMKE